MKSNELDSCNLENAEKATWNVFDDIIVPTPNWVVVGSDERGWDEVWYISDEYARHVTPNLEAFENFKACSIGSSNMSQQG